MSKHKQKYYNHVNNSKSSRLKNFTLIVFIVGLFVGGVVWISTEAAPLDNNQIVSQNGLHWHPKLSIFIKGVEETIPTNIGIGAIHQPIHTHDDTGTIHLEMQSVVFRDDLRLKNFFRNWDKPFNSEQILEYKNGPQGSVKMSVNGKPNFEFENYIMNQDDQIEIRYE